MKVFRPLELLKSGFLYLRRWRGKNGEWEYDYGKGEHTGRTKRTGGRAGTLRGVTAEDVKKMHLRFHRRGPGEGVEKTIRGGQELETILQKSTFCMISAGRNLEDPEDMKLTNAEVKARHKELIADLKAEGYVFTQTRGKYGGSEESAMVMTHNADRGNLMDLGAKYKQDSVLFTSNGHSGLIFTSGPNKGNPDMVGDGHEYVSDAKNFYTKIPLGDGSNVKFSMTLGDVVKALILQATELIKAGPTKHIRKWRGADGKWRYKYDDPKAAEVSGNTVVIDAVKAGWKIDDGKKYGAKLSAKYPGKYVTMHNVFSEVTFTLHGSIPKGDYAPGDFQYGYGINGKWKAWSERRKMKYSNKMLEGVE